MRILRSIGRAFELIGDIISSASEIDLQETLPQAFNKASGLLEKLNALEKEYPQFQSEVITPKTQGYGTNVNIGTSVPYNPDDGRQGKLNAYVYYDGTIEVHYGMETRQYGANATGQTPLTKTFKGSRANKRAAEFIRKKAVETKLIP